jgi:hypothetical protein
MRIVTRGDFDSLISSVLLSFVYDIEDIKLSHPNEITTHSLDITKNDIITNLPYHPDCGFWYDHHENEARTASEKKFKGAFKNTTSCSRVIFEYFKNVDGITNFQKVVEVADIIDTANFTIEDIQNPHHWFIIDRTLHAFDSEGNLGDFKSYFMKLMYWIRTYSLSQILFFDEVQARIEHVRSEHKVFIEVLEECSHVDGNVIITDTRKLRYFPNGNRFLIYTLFPNQNVSVSIFNKRESDQSVIFCGHNIFNRTCKTEINKLLQKYHGSGRARAGTISVSQSKADKVLEDLISQLKNNG